MSSAKSNKHYYTPSERKLILEEPRWKYAKGQVDENTLNEFFNFLNEAVVIRSDAQGIPLMTTTGIYGPIGTTDTVSLHQGREHTVEIHSSDVVDDKTKHLLHQLKALKRDAQSPSPENCAKVHAKWVSGEEGGGLPNVGKSANVFGGTGSLLVNESNIEFPILNINHPKFHAVLAYYGAKLLHKDEPFYMGYDKPIFGLEYDTSLPGYIQDYVMKDWGGGGLFVEHHPFPHIWFPNPAEGKEETNVCRVLLGRIVPNSEGEYREQCEDYTKDDGEKCLLIDGDKQNPEYRFTLFEIPTNGHYALAVDECTIHNDSFCNGRQVVFLADTKANTVALRETSPFKNIRINQVNPKVE